MLTVLTEHSRKQRGCREIFPEFRLPHFHNFYPLIAAFVLLNDQTDQEMWNLWPLLKVRRSSRRKRDEDTFIWINDCKHKDSRFSLWIQCSEHKKYSENRKWSLQLMENAFTWIWVAHKKLTDKEIKHFKKQLQQNVEKSQNWNCRSFCVEMNLLLLYSLK